MQSRGDTNRVFWLCVCECGAGVCDTMGIKLHKFFEFFVWRLQSNLMHILWLKKNLMNCHSLEITKFSMIIVKHLFVIPTFSGFSYIVLVVCLPF